MKRLAFELFKYMLLLTGTTALLTSAFVRAAPLRASVTFQQALRLMVKNDLAVKIQKTKLNIAHEKLVGSVGAFLPMVSTSYSKQNWLGTPEDSYSIEANINVFHWGADVAKYRSARFDLRARKATFTDSKLNAEAAACKALFQWMQESQILAAYDRSEKSAQLNHSIAIERYKRGYLSAEELDKVTLDLANVRALRAQTQSNLAQARETVRSLLGSDRITDKWPWRRQILSLNLNQFDRLRGIRALKVRPDYLAAKAQLNEENWLVRSSRRKVLPSIDLNYSQSKYNYNNQGFGGWSTGVTVSIPLFNGLQDETSYKSAVQSRAAAEFQLQQLERDIRSEQSEAKTNFKIAVDQYKNSLIDLGLAKRLLAADTSRFRLGRATADDLNLDLTRVTDSKRLAIQSIERAHMAYVDLLHAFGESVFNRIR